MQKKPPTGSDPLPDSRPETQSLEAWHRAARETTHEGLRVCFWDSAGLQAEGSLPKEDGADPRPTLVCLHGFPTASWDWHRVWTDLGGYFRVIAADFLGFGFSAKPRRYPYSLLDQADLIENLVHGDLGLTQVHLLAHDYGVSVAQELLARQLDGEADLEMLSICFLNGGLFHGVHRPRPIQKLLASPVGSLLAPFLTARRFRKSFSAIFGPRTQPSREELDDFWALTLHDNGRAVVPALLRYMDERRVHFDRWTRPLTQPPSDGKQRVPMRLILGPEDPVSGAHLGDHYERVVPDADVVRLEGIGHYPQVEDPQATLAAAHAFWNRLP